MRPKDREILEFGLEAHRATVSWLRGGVSAAAIANQYRKFFSHCGRSDLYLYGPCHGLGLMEVEPPWVEETSSYDLVENMTFQVDTFLSASRFGARWENGVRITADGVEPFSHRAMDVLEIGAS